MNRIKTDIARLDEMLEAICARNNCQDMSLIISSIGRNISAVIALLHAYGDNDQEKEHSKQSIKALLSSIYLLMHHARGDSAVDALSEFVETCCYTLENYINDQTD